MSILLIGAMAMAQGPEPLHAVPSSAGRTAVNSSHSIARSSFLTNLEGVTLVDQYGRSFQLAALVDRVVLFNFIFSNCGSTCPMQTRALVKVFAALPADVRDQVRFVSVSIDPANDTLEKLLRFAKSAGADYYHFEISAGDYPWASVYWW